MSSTMTWLEWTHDILINSSTLNDTKEHNGFSRNFFVFGDPYITTSNLVTIYHSHKEKRGKYLEIDLLWSIQQLYMRFQFKSAVFNNDYP